MGLRRGWMRLNYHSLQGDQGLYAGFLSAPGFCQCYDRDLVFVCHSFRGSDLHVRWSGRGQQA
eukprot:1300041-Rhodomonas_salina.2